jgi:uncharacterized RDD family membrane protein YckC
MSQDQLKIVSVTGVDVELQIAGPGSRSYAFVIDWHIRALLALAWLLVASRLVTGSWTFTGLFELSEWPAALIWAPSAVLYFFYHPVLEVLMNGRTPGKRFAGIRILTREGDAPRVGALLIRNLFRLIDSLPGFYIVGMVTTLVSQHHVRFGDMAAGTVLVIDRDHEGKSMRRLAQLDRSNSLDPKTADLVDELIERWKDLSKEKRRQLAVALLSKIDRGFTPAELQRLDDHGLLARLYDALAAPPTSSKQA